MSDRSAALTNKAKASAITSNEKSEEQLIDIKSKMIFDDVDNSHASISNEEILENSLDEVEVFFTKEQDLLAQYCVLREKLFREVDERYKIKHPEDKLFVVDYDGSETDADRFGNIIVAVDSKGKVIGGMRFLLSDFIEYSLNEVPEFDFTIKEFLKKSGLNSEAKFSEASAVVIHKSYRNRRVMKKMFEVFIEKSINLGCDYVIGVAIAAACRDHRIATKSLGYKLDIVTKYPWIKQRIHGYELRYPLVVYLKK